MTGMGVLQENYNAPSFSPQSFSFLNTHFHIGSWNCLFVVPEKFLNNRGLLVFLIKLKYNEHSEDQLFKSIIAYYGIQGKR